MEIVISDPSRKMTTFSHTSGITSKALKHSKRATPTNQAKSPWNQPDCMVKASTFHLPLDLHVCDKNISWLDTGQRGSKLFRSSSCAGFHLEKSKLLLCGATNVMERHAWFHGPPPYVSSRASSANQAHFHQSYWDSGIAHHSETWSHWLPVAKYKFLSGVKHKTPRVSCFTHAHLFHTTAPRWKN